MSENENFSLTRLHTVAALDYGTYIKYFVSVRIRIALQQFDTTVLLTFIDCNTITSGRCEYNRLAGFQMLTECCAEYWLIVVFFEVSSRIFVQLKIGFFVLGSKVANYTNLNGGLGTFGSFDLLLFGPRFLIVPLGVALLEVVSLVLVTLNPSS